TCNLTYFPRTGSVSDTGAWRFDRKTNFGLPKDSDGSKVVSFKIASNNKSTSQLLDSKQTEDPPSSDAEAAETTARSSAQLPKEELQKALATGSATLILGEVMADAEGATLYH